jgi:D-glycero-D-manno-heptose 1,7-bisphosphate phosphatase
MKRSVFFERDALLNLALKGGQQKLLTTPTRLEEFHIHETALHGLQRLKSAGFVLIVTTNQPDISAGTLSRRELDRMHELLRANLPIDEIYVCPHDENDDCPCRKPRAGMFHEAAFKYHLLLGQSFIISNRWQDAEAARLIGSTSLLIDSPWLGRGHHDFAVRDLDAAVDKVIERIRLQRKVA